MGNTTANGRARRKPAAAEEPVRLPPQSREAEQCVIGSLLRDNLLIPTVLAKLRASDFYFNEHQQIYRAIAVLHAEGSPVDTVILFQSLKKSKHLEDVGGAEYLAGLWDAAPTSANWSYYADIVRGKAGERRLIHQLSEALRDAEDAVYPIAELADRVAQGMAELAADRDADGKPRWPAPKRASEVSRDAPAVDWLWVGVLVAGHITLLSALMKSGKTTLLSLLLKALERGDDFLGLRSRPASVLYVSEESELIWSERIGAVGIADHVRFVNQPFMTKPTPAEWVAFVDYLVGLHAAERYDLVVIDTISNLWPVQDENDAAQVIGALMPLRKLTAAGLAVLPIHHVGKSDLGEGKGARGSTGLTGFVDVMIEMKRFQPGEPSDRRRVLSGWGRFREVPGELVIRLADDGKSYEAEGGRQEVRRREARETLIEILPAAGPGWGWDQIEENWPEGQGWKKEAVHAALKGGIGREFQQTGRGKKGDPHRYYRA